MTKALDDAVRAICQEQQSYCEWPKCKEACAFWGVTASRVLRAALPAEPSYSYLEGCYTDGMSETNARESWRRVRAHLLGNDA